MIAHFFTSTLRYAFFTPLYNRTRNKVFSMLGWSKEPEKTAWYSRMFGMSYNGQNTKWYSSFRVIKNTKNMLINKFLTLFGLLFFIYMMAKAIPNSIRSYKLRKQELDIERQRLEVERLRLEIEAKKLQKK